MIRMRGSRTEHNIEINVHLRDVLDVVVQKIHEKMELPQDQYLVTFPGDTTYIYEDVGRHGDRRIREATPEEVKVWEAFRTIQTLISQ